MERIRSTALHGTTEEVVEARELGGFTILTAVPNEPPPPDGYPVLYLLDGGAFFGTLVEMVRLRRNRPAMTGVEASVVVGIAHPGAYPYDRLRRQVELSPPPDGRADALLHFLAEELHPLIEERIPTDPERRVLLGHSLAGAFVLHALHHRPEVHRGYVAVSPSLWAHPERSEATSTSTPDARLERGTLVAADSELLPRRVMVAVGRYDQEVAPWQEGVADVAALRARREERAMVDRAREYCEALEAKLDRAVEVRFELCEGEDHASVVPVGFGRALRFVAGVA